MKQTLALLVIIAVLFSCKKEFNSSSSDDYLQNVKTSLKDRVPPDDYANLDFTKAVLSKVDNIQPYILRIPFTGKEIKNDFVLIKTNAVGKIIKGKIVHLEGSESEFGSGIIKRRRWDGKIIISSLDRKTVLNSAITDGYIEAFQSQSNLRTSDMAAPNSLPEVIVVAYLHNGGISFSDWMYLQSFFGDNGAGGGNYNGDYFSISGTGGGGSNNGNGNGSPLGYGSGITLDPTIHVDIETYVDHPAIDIEKYIKCFDNIPDDGSTCSIEIFTDLPVDNDPTKLFDWKTESPGHVFLQFKKHNGNQNALQNIGFYPNTNWKNILDADPVDSKVVDDGQHEFQASLKMNISPYLLRYALEEAKDLSKLKYDMDEFNCTDFAMEVFNYIRTPLDIPRYGIPGGIGIYPSRTPQGLWIKLKEMKDNSDPEAKNITVDNYKHFVANSDGPCN